MQHAEFSEREPGNFDHSQEAAEGLCQDHFQGGRFATSSSDSQRAYSSSNAAVSSLKSDANAVSREGQATDLRGSESQNHGWSQALTDMRSQTSSVQNGSGSGDSSSAQTLHKIQQERGQPHERVSRSSAAATGNNVSNTQDELLQQPGKLEDRSPQEVATATSASDISGTTSQPSPDGVAAGLSSVSEARNLQSPELDSQAEDRRYASSSKEHEDDSNAVGNKAAEEEGDAGTGLASFADIESSESGRYALQHYYFVTPQVLLPASSSFLCLMALWKVDSLNRILEVTSCDSSGYHT